MAHRDDDAQTGDWFTSSYSDNQGGQCVEARRMGTGPAGKMAVRDSKNPDGTVFEFDRASWMDFLDFATEGEPSP
ncbi:DUF397 domain-containing protein [Streptomyces olivaceus]|uniref:DUF397 domain-containing protein n=1 Tax=Streptomyces olivaceus TaxID=47716 RepID=UPI0022EEDD0B|nr:DUF397 domain-containing protein [Streptomyces olivaceus]GHI98055.1 hypothetical protein TPA0905_75260 [Streptomyces olivaceus]